MLPASRLPLVSNLLRSIAVLSIVVAWPAAATTRTWTGSVGSSWSSPLNWKEGAPLPGDDLVFPAVAASGSATSENDFPPGTPFDSVSFTAAHLARGNEISIRRGLSTEGGPVTLALPIRLVSAQTWKINDGGPLTVERSVTIDQFTLDIGMRSPLDFPLAANGAPITFNAPIVGGGLVRAANFTEVRFGPGATFSGRIETPGFLAIDGARLTAAISGDIVIIGGGGTTGDLSAAYLLPSRGAVGNVRLNPRGTFAVRVVTVEDLPALKVNGTVDLSGGFVMVSSAAPLNLPEGLRIKIIDNDGTDPVAGTFEAIFANDYVAAVDYAGGDGNDVVVTVGAGSVTTLKTSQNMSLLGSPVTLEATVSRQSSSRAVTGQVVFFADELKIGQAPIGANGTARLTISTLPAGYHLLSASYTSPDGVLLSRSFSSAVPHLVQTVHPRGRSVRH
jgi:hypothetical protein